MLMGSFGSSSSLRIGKLNSKELKRYILSNLKLYDDRMIFGPQVGGDSAVLRFGSRALVLTVDPILGATQNLGELAINVCLNDLACLGAQPRALLIVLLLPQGFTARGLQSLVRELAHAAQAQGVAIVGGHTEVVLGLSRSPIVIAAGVGEAEPERVVLPRAQPGDKVVLTKSAGLEGAAILAAEFAELERSLARSVLRRAKRFIRFLSVRAEAEIGVRLGATAMHDPTDRGVMGGLEELAQASGVGLRIQEDQIPVASETKEICDYFKINPLELISSGSLLLTCRAQDLNQLLNGLRGRKIPAAVIGEIRGKEEGCRSFRSDGSETLLRAPELDPLWQLLLK
jgi:hydrogenase maturation factor